MLKKLKKLKDKIVDGGKARAKRASADKGEAAVKKKVSRKKKSAVKKKAAPHSKSTTKKTARNKSSVKKKAAPRRKTTDRKAVKKKSAKKVTKKQVSGDSTQLAAEKSSEGKSKRRKSSPKMKQSKQRASNPKAASKDLARSKRSRKPSGKQAARRKKIVDPEANLEAQRYENPVASRALILETITEEGMMTQSSLFEALQVTPDQEEGVGRRLAAMVRDGQLVKNRRGGFLPVDEKHLIRGHIIAHAEGFGFLVPDEGGDDLFLSAKQMRTVFHGDRAIATVSGVDRRGRLEGSLVSVIERANKSLIGRLFIEDGVAYVVPDNKRISHNVLIPSDMLADAEAGQIVKLEISSYPTIRREAVGKIVEVVGEHMAPGMEIEIAIHNHGIPNEFPQAVMAQADAYGDEVREADKKGRLDLRATPLVTIDGADARDFDDAVYCEPRGDAGWKLLVAIADVAHYVGLSSALDDEAYERATSVYFPGRVVPMLPEALSNGLCSINPDVDRLCMVCEMFVNKDGEIEGYDFKEAVMRSHARLTYNQVAEALEAEAEGRAVDAHIKDVFPHVANLYAMYQKLDAARRRRGTIEFDTTETVINFTSDQRIESIRPSVRNDAHKVIEECMISANVCAAKFIAKQKLPSLYRVHEDPTDEKIDDLRGFLADVGLKLGDPSRKITSADYAKLSEELKGRDDYHMIQTLMLRSMKQAIYKAENLGHFGLALTHYTHFTSPIRRYPDLLVHRALKHIIHKRKASDYAYSPERMMLMGEHCSNNERRANEATRDAEFALKCEYMLDKIGESYDATVTSVVQFGLFVELDEHYVEGLIHITSLPKDYYVFDPKVHQLVGENRGIVFGLNDKVHIRVARVDIDDRKIDFELVSEYG